MFQKQPPEMFCKKEVLRNFSKFTGKQCNFIITGTLAQVLSCEFSGTASLGVAPHLLAEQQNIFSKRFQFFTIEFFVFFRKSESNQNKRKNLWGRGSFAQKAQIPKDTCTRYDWYNKHPSKFIYADIWNQEYVDNIFFDFFVIQEVWYAIVSVTV